MHPALVVAKFETHLAAPVPEVRHRDVIADGGDAARHVEQLLAQAPDVHQHDDGGERPALVRMRYERVHPAVGGWNVANRSLDHRSARDQPISPGSQVATAGNRNSSTSSTRLSAT